MDKYQFNRQFRLKLLSLCLDGGWFARYGSGLIEPDYFEEEDEQAVAKVFLAYHDAYAKVVTDVEDAVAMADPAHEDVVRSVFLAKLQDNSLALDTAIQFAKEQAAKRAVLDGIEDIRNGDLDRLQERIKLASRVGMDMMMPGIDLVADADMWLSEDIWTSKIRTGWLHVDQFMGGGMGVPELTTILGASGTGKTTSLANIAVGAAGIGSAKNVVIITHELNVNNYAKRMGARLVFRFPTKADLMEYKLEFAEAARKLLPGRIRIVGGVRMDTASIERTLEVLAAEGFHFDLIIDDYLDLVTPRKTYKDRRYELSDNWVWFRGVGEKWGCPTVTASQVVRDAYSKEVVTTADVAEDIGKVNHSDNVIALCQTMAEKRENRCRLFGAKVRDNESSFMINAKYLPKSQAIVTIGVAQRKSDDDVQQETTANGKAKRQPQYAT